MITLCHTKTTGFQVELNWRESNKLLISDLVVRCLQNDPHVQVYFQYVTKCLPTSCSNSLHKKFALLLLSGILGSCLVNFKSDSCRVVSAQVRHKSTHKVFVFMRTISWKLSDALLTSDGATITTEIYPMLNEHCLCQKRVHTLGSLK